MKKEVWAVLFALIGGSSSGFSQPLTCPQGFMVDSSGGSSTCVPYVNDNCTQTCPAGATDCCGHLLNPGQAASSGNETSICDYTTTVPDKNGTPQTVSATALQALQQRAQTIDSLYQQNLPQTQGHVALIFSKLAARFALYPAGAILAPLSAQINNAILINTPPSNGLTSIQTDLGTADTCYQAYLKNPTPVQTTNPDGTVSTCYNVPCLDTNDLQDRLCPLTRQNTVTSAASIQSVPDVATYLTQNQGAMDSGLSNCTGCQRALDSAISRVIATENGTFPGACP